MSFSFGASFGATTPAPAVGATPASAATFSFATQAATATPATGTLPFGTSVAIQAATPAPGFAQPPLAAVATAGPAAPLAIALKPPSEVTSKTTVEEIIQNWNAELGKQTTVFGNKARELAEWDQRIFRNRKALLAMEQEMAKVSSAQEALVRQLSVLEVHQGEINETLKGMETELDKLSSDTDPLIDEAKERDELFATAEQVSAKLARISTELCDAIELVNSDRAAGQPPSGDPLASAQKILNNQLSTLIWLEKKAQEIAKRVEHLDL